MVVGAVVFGVEVLDFSAGAVVVATAATVVVVDLLAASWVRATSISDSTRDFVASSEKSRSMVVVVDLTSPAWAGDVVTGSGSGVEAPTTTKSRTVVRRRAPLSAYMWGRRMWGLGRFGWGGRPYCRLAAAPTLVFLPRCLQFSRLVIVSITVWSASRNPRPNSVLVFDVSSWYLPSASDLATSRVVPRTRYSA